MTIALTTAPGGLFTRLGKIIYAANSVNSFRGTGSLSGASISSVGTFIDSIVAQYASANQQLVDSMYSARDGHRGSYAAILTTLRTLAQATVIKMADDDVHLVTKDLKTAVKEVIKQMKASSDLINDPVVSATATAGSANTGTGKCVVSVKNPDGTQADYCFAETIDVTCTSDNQVGATAGREPFGFQGDAAQSDELSWDWPAGSGASGNLSAIDATQSSVANGNLLVNSNFESWTSNVPDGGWAILVGAAGTDILKGSSAFGGSYNLQFVGDGATLSSLALTFNQTSTTAGSTVKLKPQTVYMVNCWVKVPSAPSTGVMQINLVDGSNAIVSDDASTANTITQSLTGALTSYTAVTGTFRTPSVMPSSIKLRVRISTAVESGKNIHVDHLAMCEAVRAFPGGPFLSVFSSPTSFITGDTYAVAVSQDFSGAFAKGLSRLLGLRGLGLQIPSGTATINENLVAA